MSEGHGDPPADVRSFLPRPGEPVEQYAERLRALHRDLTLVLHAVERGLAAAAQSRDVAPPVPAHDPIEIVPEPADPPAPSRISSLPPRSRMPRVEVMPAPSGEQRRDEQSDRREPPPQPPAPDAPAPRWETGEPRPPTRLPARPSDATAGSVGEPEWVDRGEDFTAPTFPARPHRLGIAPLIATTFTLMWLVVVGLLIAVLLS